MNISRVWPNISKPNSSVFFSFARALCQALLTCSHGERGDRSTGAKSGKSRARRLGEKKNEVS